MQRIIFLAMAGLLLAVASAPASSQLGQPTPPVVTPKPQDTGMGPRLNNTQATKSVEIPSDLNQRPQSSSPIPSTGPANEALAKPAGAAFDPATSNQRRRVLDAAGRPVEGTIRVAPNRVYDPATGRYYRTTPPGQPG
jgi:hypothetical protein